MARIPLIIEKALRDGEQYSERLFLTGTLYVHDAHIGLSILTFAVDTGSPFTLISLKDAARMKIPQNLLHLKEQLLFGGAACYRMTINRPTTLYLRTVVGKRVSFPFAKYGTAVPISSDQKALERVAVLPSLVGMDFLSSCKLKLVYDPSRDEAYLETEHED